MDQQSLKTEETLPKRESSTGKPCFSSYQINKQMEKNGTMLFIYQLIMQGFAFLVVFYMMLGFTFLEKTFDLENLEYIQSEFVALTYLYEKTGAFAFGADAKDRCIQKDCWYWFGTLLCCQQRRELGFLSTRVCGKYVWIYTLYKYGARYNIFILYYKFYIYRGSC